METFMRRSIVIGVAAVALLLSAVSCSTYRHCQWRTGDPSVVDQQSQYSLSFIESDDEGWFWDRRQVDDAMAVIKAKAAERDTIVVMFVHGWHHSAECCDGNVEGFRHTLSNLQKLSPNFNIVGLYIGWRGRSLPGWLDYLTFWGRKGAAERIGQNDLKEFMARLQQVFVQHRPDARRPSGSQAEALAQEPERNFLGLVSIGHSFGGQVLLKSVMGTLEDQLQRLNPNPAYLRDAQPGTPAPDRESIVTGFGDLIILINPAAEASQYHRLHVLSRGLDYSQLQTPVMLTVSAENDTSRHKLFTLGRMLGEIFTGKPRKENQVERDVERRALGVYPGHVTHQLVPVDSSVELVAKTIEGDARQCKHSKACKSDWYEWSKEPTVRRPNSVNSRDPRLPTFDFSKDVVFSNIELSKLADTTGGYATPLDYQPFIVARASKKIIDDHSGFFTEPFVRFLVPYIAYIERKSQLNIRVKQQRREDEMRTIEQSRPGAAAQ
jgi:hypothetical protein